MSGGNSPSDCGCEILFLPCEAHKATLESGDETVHIEVEFASKYTRVNASNHRVDLERTQRIRLGLDDEPMEFNETTLADMIQGVVDEDPYRSEAFLLRALANALRGDDAHHRLQLRQKRRGRWESPADSRAKHRQHLAWIVRLHRLKASGWQTDAAVHRIAETPGNSVSTIYAGMAEEQTWQAILSEGLDSVKAVRAWSRRKGRKSSPK
ncbi:MAG: hypothetical protein ACO1OD_09210 [Croceibacterium sp.]